MKKWGCNRFEIHAFTADYRLDATYPAPGDDTPHPIDALIRKLEETLVMLRRFAAADSPDALASIARPVSQPASVIDIVFDGPPEHEGGRFVEVENQRGESIQVGEWVRRPDGYWVLRIDVASPPSEVEALRAKVADYEADAKATLAGECAPDEQHCSCVPHLRREMARLKAALDSGRNGELVAAENTIARLEQTLRTLERDGRLWVSEVDARAAGLRLNVVKPEALDAARAEGRREGELNGVAGGNEADAKATLADGEQPLRCGRGHESIRPKCPACHDLKRAYLAWRV